MSVLFDFDWVDPGPLPDLACAATMSSLRIEVAGELVTRVRDLDAQKERDRVIVPLSQVAEWLVSNWFALTNEPGHIGSDDSDHDFSERHDLYFAGSGYVTPSLRFIPSGRRHFVQWTPYGSKYSRIEYVSGGAKEIRSGDVDREFRRLIESVIHRLQERLPGHDFIEELSSDWSEIQSMGKDEREFCEAAATMGVDPFDVEDLVADEIVDFCSRTDASVRRDALALARGGSIAAVSSWLDSATGALLSQARPSEERAWKDIRSSIRSGGGTLFQGAPWNQGYAMARSLRDHLGLGLGHVDLDGLNGDRLAVSSQAVRAPSDRIEGLVGSETPACVIARSDAGEARSRFLRARSLGDFLGTVGTGYGVLSTLRTDRQARSRAFAAELLAPSESLRQRVTHSPVPIGVVKDLGEEFVVSTEVIRRQLENHDIAKIAP